MAMLLWKVRGDCLDNKTGGDINGKKERSKKVPN